MSGEQVKTVSMVIPCRNEEGFIAKCLDSFVQQTYPMENFEVLVCDGMSDDNTRNIIKGYSEKYSNIKMIDNPGRTAPRAMNRGIKASNMDAIIIFGAHSIADKDFIKKTVEKLNTTTAGCVGGIAETINDTPKGEAIARAMSSPFGVGNALFRYAKEEMYVDTVGSAAYKRTVLDEVGYFDEELVRNQDDELNFRVTKAGYKILLTPDVKYTYYSRSSYKKLWKQYYQYGFWKVRVMQKHGRPASIRHLVPLAFVLFNIVGIIGSIFSRYIFYIWLAQVAAYLALTLSQSAKLTKDNGKLFKYLPWIFPILHGSYGLGFLNGLFSFYIFKSTKSIDKNTKMSR